MEISQEQKEQIQKAKEKIFEDLGITVERQEELAIIAKDTMEFLKTAFKMNEVNLDIERAFVCNMIKEKSEMVSNIYYLCAINPNEEENENGREDNE